MKKIDETTARLGVAMRYARNKCKMPLDEAAATLRIMPDELYEYERGRVMLPYDIMERVFIMGYKMMMIRMLESVYRRQRKMFRKFNQNK